jgi:hypothetical protein
VACDADRTCSDDLCSLDYDGAAELAHALKRNRLIFITVP